MNNVLLIGAIALAGAFFISYERGVELLNFGAFIAFMGVNAAAFVRYFVRAREKALDESRRPACRIRHLLLHLAAPEPARENRRRRMDRWSESFTAR